VVDFEKCFYGPCGLDLGLFLSNYIWYYAAHPSPSSRRSLSSSVSALLEAYKSAFFVQAVGVIRETKIEVHVEELWNKVSTIHTSSLHFLLMLINVLPTIVLLQLYYTCV
jgi:5-methylthioribose kinase